MEKELLASAAEAYAAKVAGGATPAEAAFAAAVVLNLPAAEALNVLLAEGVVSFEFYARPVHKPGHALGFRLVPAS